MSRVPRLALVILLLLAGYLAMLPATWLDRLLQHWTEGSLAMTDTTGTVWHGTGNLQALLPNGDAVTLAPASWSIALGELMRLRLRVSMHSTQTQANLLDLTLTLGEVHVHAAKLELPAAMLGVFSPTLRSAAFTGQLALRADDVRLDGERAAGKVRTVWMDAGSDLSPVRPLGSYQLDLDGQGDGLEFRLTTLGGALNLSGTGSLHPGKTPNVRITAVPIEAKRQELAPLLRVLGRESAPGTYLLTIDRNVRAVSG